jgi:hypothetical protein
MLRKWIGLIVGGVVTGWVGAAEPAETVSSPAEKSAFTLWNPTPRPSLREMNTDRPDKTESPYTVDAGHVQVEADVLNYSYDSYNSASDHTRVETVAIAPFNLKVGLCNSADLQIIVPTYNSIRIHDTRARSVHCDRGFGDLITRLKYNFWGNDGGDTAFAAMPFVKWPTGSGGVGNDSVEGGLILPLSVSLPAGWDMGTMLELDLSRDDDEHGHHAEVINSLTFSHSIVGELSGYVEFFSNVSTEQHGTPWVTTADVGLTYALTPDIQLDCGVNLGLTRAADDINPFLGISVRF